MFIDNDVSKDKLFLRLSQQVSYHYEIETFRGENSVDAYLQEILGQSISKNIEETIITDSVIEDFDKYENQDIFLQKLVSDYEVNMLDALEHNCTFESVMLELSEL